MPIGFSGCQQLKVPPCAVTSSSRKNTQTSSISYKAQIAFTSPQNKPMKLGIINSAFQQVGVDTATGLTHIKRIGFDTVDVFTEAVGISRQEVALVAKTAERLELPIISLPVVAVGLIDFNVPVRAFHIERCKRYIDLARTWGARNVLVVLGEYIWQREVIPPQAQWQWAIDTCRTLGDYAERKKVDIALELEPFRLSLLNNVHQMAKFIDECNHPRVRANIDISHLVLSDSSPTDLRLLKNKAIHVHLSDCDGKVHGDLPPGRGMVKFAPYLQAIKELAIDGVISVELEYSPIPSEIVQWVEEAYRETAKLMQLAGLRELETSAPVPAGRKRFDLPPRLASRRRLHSKPA
jgi:sugar phosphate isomerase/epimerase